MSHAGVLALDGVLDRARAEAWTLDKGTGQGVGVIDLTAVERVDVAGLALVAELMERAMRATGKRPALRGNPPGLEELARAYRIDAGLTEYP